MSSPLDWHGDHFAAECDNACRPAVTSAVVRFRGGPLNEEIRELPEPLEYKYEALEWVGNAVDGVSVKHQYRLSTDRRIYTWQGDPVARSSF